MISLAYAAGALLTTLATVAMGTTLVRPWAVRRGYVDHPDHWRRVHGTPTSNVGGIAVALGTAASFASWYGVIFPGVVPRLDTLAILLGGLVLFLMGFRDDLRHIPAGVKLTLEVLLASAVFAAGVRFSGGGIFPSFGGATLLASYLVTTFWIVGTTNAFNLIDGSDGVATGAALFGAVTLGLICALYGEMVGALLALVLVGACLGFLLFNFPPASIFLGDGGSLFLGSTLSMLGVLAANAVGTPLALLVPPIALGVPLLDTTLAIIRRFLRREPIFSPDRGHVHHRLRGLGYSSRGVALTIYVACVGLAGVALLVAWGNPLFLVPVLVAFPILLVAGIIRLRMPELLEFAHLIRRGFQGRSMVARNLRVHAASEVLKASVGGKAIIEALDYAFVGSEFSRLELWLPETSGASLIAVGNGRVSRDGSGYRMVLAFHAGSRAPEIEVRIPVALEDARSGDLHLFRDGESEPQFTTDLMLVRSLLVPALVRALGRVGHAPGMAPPAPRTFEPASVEKEAS